MSAENWLAFFAGIAGAAIGLWWGERGRRIDVQWRERVQRPRGWRPPLVHPPSVATEPSSPDDEAIRERMIRDAMNEGLTRAEAEADVDELRARANQDAPVL